MKQAIEEGFILDVLANYTTYKSYYEIEKSIEDNPLFDTAKAQKKLGEILDASLTLGATQMGGIAFEVSNAETLKDEARKAAMVNARRRAELYAAAAGASLGQVISIAEDVRMAGPRPMLMGARAASMQAEAVPVEVGSMKLEATVHVTWSLR